MTITPTMYGSGLARGVEVGGVDEDEQRVEARGGGGAAGGRHDADRDGEARQARPVRDERAGALPGHHVRQSMPHMIPGTARPITTCRCECSTCGSDSSSSAVTAPTR